MPLIYIVRHGETDANVNGQVNDKNVITPLNKTGKMQAAKTGKYFKKYRCKTNSGIKIYASPSIRTKETAELIANQLKADVIYDDRLIEIDHGLMSGSTDGDKIQKKYDKAFKKMPKDPIEKELAYPEFDKILEKDFKREPTSHIIKRVKSFYDSLPNEDVIVVTHNGIISTTIRTLFGILSAADVKGDLSNGKNCTITCILSENKKYKLITLPNTLHLAKSI